MELYKKDQTLSHPKFGEGSVIVDEGDVVIIRFAHEIKACKKEDVTLCLSTKQLLERKIWDSPLKVINRTQARIIYSINDIWGVFTRTRIDLLPHQLWVCYQVTKRWPTNLLIADDVGLGKTIEAGLILTALLARKKVERLLIMCPAALVSQWQIRLLKMFDIRPGLYVSVADTDNYNFWKSNKQIIASLDTLKIDSNNRHNRILDSDPWDLIIVDEAHHLNADRHQKLTLGYQLMKKLRDKNLAKSILFFTGTPHRGKDFGFISLLQLLRPDLFDNRLPISSQLPRLKQVIIRNNKYSVTDIKGNHLFIEPVIKSEAYHYSESEQVFYEMLSDFIMKGKAYASSLSQQNMNVAMLVLISMQKLASSSVAAIRKAMKGRLSRMIQSKTDLHNLQKTLKNYQELEDADDEIAQDKKSIIEENIAHITSELRLIENEESTLQQLLEAAETIDDETKINTLLDVIENQFKDRSVLFFTEYKATQSLLMSALIRKFGDTSVTFINGDEKAVNVILSDGQKTSLTKTKKNAAEEFNTGQVRFLVSTEAGGEGIDLHNNCHTLVHVDMPWNPMRMHQRVGRLLRIGQKQQVEVLILRNPETVETRIWDKLYDRIESINTAFQEVMDEPEDFFQLILGMTSPKTFKDIFVEASLSTPDNLSDWFNQKTNTFGGKNVLDTVRELVGSVNKFDFQSCSEKIPKVDLIDLQPFFETALVLNNRRITTNDENKLTFKTPDNWKTSTAIRRRYSDMTFDRYDQSNDTRYLLGIGHKIIDIALEEAQDRQSKIASMPAQILPHPLIIYRLFEKTTDSALNNDIIVGIEVQLINTFKILKDWELLKYINELPFRKEFMRNHSSRVNNIDEIHKIMNQSDLFLQNHLNDLHLEFHYPDYQFLSLLWPSDFQYKP
jgi:ERCC4-related helicase